MHFAGLQDAVAGLPTNKTNRTKRPIHLSVCDTGWTRSAHWSVRLHPLRRRPALGSICASHVHCRLSVRSLVPHAVISGINHSRTHGSRVCSAENRLRMLCRYYVKVMQEQSLLRRNCDGLKGDLELCSTVRIDLAGACRATCREEQTHRQVGYACGWRVRPAPA